MENAALVRLLRRQQAALAAFGSFALRQHDLMAVLTEAARVCAEGLDVRFCKICCYRPAENDLLIVAGFGWQPGVIGQVVSRADDTTPQGRAFSSGKPSICNDVRNDRRLDLPGFYASHGIISTIDVVISGDAGPYGVLEIDSDVAHDYDEHDVDYLTSFANILGEAVAAARVALLEVTNRQMRAMVDQLAESETRFRTVVEAAPVSIVVFDQDGRITMVNLQAEQTFGYSRAELLYQPVDLLQPLRFRTSPSHALFHAANLLTPPGRGEPVRLGLHKDGHEFEIEISLKPVVTTHGDTTFACITDISGRVQLEAQLRQSQKMESIGRLTAGVAHDFNNLLHALTGSLEILLDDVSNDADSVECGQIALRAARRGGELTHQLLAFSRQQTLHPRVVKIGEIFREITGLVSRTFGPDIRLSVSHEADRQLVMADPAQLQAALLNLAVNARDAMAGAGRLSFSAHLADEDASWPSDHGRFVIIAVQDTGSGMDEATTALACEPFFTTKGAGGSGLGLSMVQGFARQSGGDLRIRSAVGRGTSVEIWLPTVVPPADMMIGDGIRKQPARGMEQRG